MKRAPDFAGVVVNINRIGLFTSARVMAAFASWGSWAAT